MSSSDPVACSSSATSTLTATPPSTPPSMAATENNNTSTNDTNISSTMVSPSIPATTTITTNLENDTQDYNTTSTQMSSTPVMMEVQTEYATRQSVPKTSISHPINISWLLPNDFLPLLTYCDLPEQLDVYDLTDPVIYQQLLPLLEQAIQHGQQQSLPVMGNLALSSCPGKKVRLTGPVRGRAAINRDLDLDFTRMRSFGITTIVCCLEDTELDYLGATWKKYAASAKKYGLHVLRLPMVEGSCPDTLEEVDNVINIVNNKIWKGENVLAHCRGGVGRAGLFACCWMINNTLCLSAERAIRTVRARRSPKAIETMRQAEFVIHYAQFITRKLEQQMMEHRDQRLRRLLLEEQAILDGTDKHHTVDHSLSTHPSSSMSAVGTPLDMTHTDQTLSVPSVFDIGNLEQSMRNKSLSSSTVHSNSL
ncbi:protein-tyrosine phosphatase-like protein [Halteromyces radiatus]|uniref:protein-tyrosine phosphatase-like protein n=1 Tax=Halteromyces radiatus TaxID=101107 RepID=UPI00221ED9BB|nr:protein-tyrosine phosphatase-like protein [Halteromyces radiatus]KAI8097698.1 protein-tyrosine phosphatase-like protein [Halteromyces radiatus]